MPQPHSETERRISDGAGQLAPAAKCLQGRLGLRTGSVAVPARPAWLLGSPAAWTPLHQ